MWSPTDAGCGRVPAGPPVPVRRPGLQRVSRPVLTPALVLLLLLGLAFSGCAGYHLASSGSSILGDGSKTLKVKGVDYPTLQPWLPNAIRSRLRDEIGARYLAKWVDSGSADYEIQINVLSFTTREWVRTEIDTTQLFNISLTIEAILYDGSTNKEIWRSGRISYAERQEHADEERELNTDIITQVMRQLADAMRNTF